MGIDFRKLFGAIPEWLELVACLKLAMFLREESFRLAIAPVSVVVSTPWRSSDFPGCLRTKVCFKPTLELVSLDERYL